MSSDSGVSPDIAGPEAPFTADYCRSAANACNALIISAKTKSERRHWERVERAWLERLKEAEKEDA